MPTSNDAAQALAAPRRLRWTKRRLRTALTLAYGQAAGGWIHTAGPADDLGISQRQLQRWLAGDGRQTLTAQRLDRIMTLIAHRSDNYGSRPPKRPTATRNSS